jgi:deoxyribonuclease-4
MKFGSHVSIRNGYLGAAQEAVKLGGEAFQYFPKNPRSLSVKSYDQEDARACKKYCLEKEIKSIAHTPYPTNLSVEDREHRKVTIESLLNDLEIANACGSVGVVVHFGKYKGKDPLSGYKYMIEVLNEVLSQWEHGTLLLIENNAGQGVKMGTTLEELVQVRQLTDYPEKIGFCLDTCHAFASGLWTGFNWSIIEEKGKELNYFSHLKAIHLNDSVYPSGSFRDRHANIGRGMIGEKAFREMVQSDVFKGLPVILETPSSSAYSHKEEIAYLGSLS